MWYALGNNIDELHARQGTEDPMGIAVLTECL